MNQSFSWLNNWVEVGRDMWERSFLFKGDKFSVVVKFKENQWKSFILGEEGEYLDLHSGQYKEENKNDVLKLISPVELKNTIYSQSYR